MKKLYNSNFEIIQNIFEEIDFNYEAARKESEEELFKSWEEIIGKKISKFSKLLEISSDGILTVVCADSFVANELYFEKDKIFSLVNEKAEKLGIKIKDIRFNYKRWKEQIYE